MSAEQSRDQALEEFQAYVQCRVAETNKGGIFALSLNGFQFDLRIALAAMALLLVAFLCTSAIDARHYRSIIAERRYSIGTSRQYWWRYDALDNEMYDPRRKLSLNDRVHLRETGLHVTYEDYRAHRTIRKFKMGSGILLAICALVTVVAGWRRLQAEPLVETFGDADDAALPAAPRAGSGPPVFGRRAG